MWFVWVCVVLVLCAACVALYACGVRRLKGLWRVCLCFSCFSSSLPSFSSLYLLFVLHLVCFVLVVFCLSSCLVLFVLVSLWVLCFLFPFRMYEQKERAQFLASSLVLLWACLDVLKHYRYFLRFIVAISNPVAGDSCNIFGLVCWVVYYLPVFVNS